jgi:RNA polymerase sigma-70 factor (ECF subfamily)
LCTDYFRSKQAPSLETTDNIPSTYASSEQLAENREVYEAVLKLRPVYRTAITLHYWHGYSYEKIAETMGVPIGSVRGWLYRAKKQLKEVLS